MKFLVYKNSNGKKHYDEFEEVDKLPIIQKYSNRFKRGYTVIDIQPVRALKREGYRLFQVFKINNSIMRAKMEILNQFYEDALFECLESDLICVKKEALNNEI